LLQSHFRPGISQFFYDLIPFVAARGILDDLGVGNEVEMKLVA
jgi:hypothetical protein